MSNEQTQQLMYQLQMLETYFAELTQKENTLLSVMRETASAIESIKSIKEKPDSDTLVPVGMGTYVKTKISSNDKIVLNVGAGVAIEKDKDATINYLESRIKEIEVALRDTSAQKQDVANQLEQGKQEANRLMQAAQAQNQK